MLQVLALAYQTEDYFKIGCTEKPIIGTEAQMAFDVGPTMQTMKGYGFAIRNAHRGPITFIEFATKTESEIAEARVREAIRNAISLTDTQGRTW